MRTTHGEGSRQKGITPEYRTWASMLARCHIVSATSYEDYGGRGITVCEEWRGSYEAFLAHVGRKPSPGHEIDRIDNERGYEPGNVRWATRTEQVRNRRNARQYEYQGRICCLSEWAQITGVPRATLQDRILVSGWSVERALSTPTQNLSEAHASKLTMEKAREIRAAAIREPYKLIAKRYGIALTTVDKIVAGRSWKERK